MFPCRSIEPRKHPELGSPPPHRARPHRPTQAADGRYQEHKNLMVLFQHIQRPCDFVFTETALANDTSEFLPEHSTIIRGPFFWRTCDSQSFSVLVFTHDAVPPRLLLVTPSIRCFPRVRLFRTKRLLHSGGKTGPPCLFKCALRPTSTHRASAGTCPSWVGFCSSSPRQGVPATNFCHFVHASS